ncbi:hypothetical protein M5689_010788 [Euphorbia peplus]|nr:hypothetical protein M5689_010788 [Euphorbia peplus]
MEADDVFLKIDWIGMQTQLYYLKCHNRDLEFIISKLDNTSHQQKKQLLFQQGVKDITEEEEEDEKTKDGRFVEDHEFGPETEEENDLQSAIKSSMVAFKYVELAEWTVDD